MAREGKRGGPSLYIVLAGALLGICCGYSLEVLVLILMNTHTICGEKKCVKKIPFLNLYIIIRICRCSDNREDLGLCYSCKAYCRVHCTLVHLYNVFKQDDTRSHFIVSMFGFLKDGTLTVNITKFSVNLPPRAVVDNQTVSLNSLIVN